MPRSSSESIFFCNILRNGGDSTVIRNQKKSVGEFASILSNYKKPNINLLYVEILLTHTGNPQRVHANMVETIEQIAAEVPETNIPPDDIARDFVLAVYESFVIFAWIVFAPEQSGAVLQFADDVRRFVQDMIPNATLGKS